MNDTSLVEMAERLDSLRERANELRTRDRDLFAEIKSRRSAGEDPGELRSERLAVRLEQEEVDELVPALVAEIAEARKAALHARAVDRVREIHRSQSGHAGEQPARLRRLVAAARTYQQEAAAVNSAYLSQRSLGAEEAALRQRFDGLPPTDPKVILMPGREPLVGEAVAAVQRATFPVVPSHLGRAAIPSGSPGASLIAEAGPTENELRDREKKEWAKLAKEEADRKILSDPGVQRELDKARATPSGWRAGL